MCIIIISGNGNAIKRSELENSNKNNSDGIGIAWIDKNRKPRFKKGWSYWDFAEFYKFYRKEVVGKSHVVHFRIGTSGLKSKEMMHPFPVNTDISKSNLLEGQYDTIFQNGIAYNYERELIEFCHSKKIVPPSVKDKSDTAIIADMVNLGLPIEEAVKLGGKWTLVNKYNIWYWGDFIKGDKGILYSNSTYSYSYKSVSKDNNYYGIDWDDAYNYQKHYDNTNNLLIDRLNNEDDHIDEKSDEVERLIKLYDKDYLDDAYDDVKGDVLSMLSKNKELQNQRVNKTKNYRELFNVNRKKNNTSEKKAFGGTWKEDRDLYNLGKE